MPQLHCYVPESLAARLRQRAEAQGLSVSRYLAELVRHDVEASWPASFFSEVVGGWQGEALTRPAQGESELRDALQPAGDDVRVPA